MTEPITPVAANDNASVSAVDSLKKALDAFVTKAALSDLVAEEIASFTAIPKKIELKVGDTTTTMPADVRHYLFGDILSCISLSLPTALIGPAGSGKSTCCEQVAKGLGLKFYLQNGVTGSHELTGYMDAHGRYNTTPFRDAFANGGFILVDEADTSDPGALKWLNTALANGYAVFPDVAEPVVRHVDFRIAIAANTWGSGADRLYVGANQLDASTLDRFVFINFRYDEKLEGVVANNVTWTRRVQAYRKAALAENARAVISPRASINGSKLLSIGWNLKKVEDSVIWKGMDEALVERIKNTAYKSDKIERAKAA